MSRDDKIKRRGWERSTINSERVASTTNNAKRRRKNCEETQGKPKDKKDDYIVYFWGYHGPVEEGNK